ncbi:MAG TPA: MFS transporter [Candidatus Acidoferrum sp.]|nr:MFS transporter [Candidatus Acidoferrum sp.]
MDSLQIARIDAARNRTATAAVLVSFGVAGVVTTILGPILPVLIARWSLTDERAGLFFTVQFATNMIGLASLSAILPRWGYKAVLVPGYIAIALGLAGLNANSAQAGLAATALYGYGLGLVLASSNLWVAEAAESRRLAALSILNFAWGIGAVICPPVVLVAARHGAASWFLYGVAAASLCAALALTAVHLGIPPSRPSADSSSRGSPAHAAGVISAIALGALYYLYVGTENSVAGWVAALAKRMSAGPSDLWALAPMFFWAGLLGGRAFVPVNPLRTRERTLVIVGLTMGLAGSAVLLVVKTFWEIAACSAVCGLGFAAVYPVLLAWLTKQFGGGARRIGNIFFALSSLGGATMPWLVGFFSTRQNDLRAGLVVPAAACVAMLICLSWVPRWVTESEASEQRGYLS